MAAKKYEVIIDVNSGSVKIAGGEMLSLNQQVRILQKELGRVDGKEFEVLSNKLNETKDRAATVNARSRELFGTLSLLPGPVGLFASKIDGAISLMKVFSGFTLKDIRAQFSALGADIVEIGKKIYAGIGLQKVYQVTTTATASVLRAVGIQATAASVGVRAFSTALVATGVGALVIGLGYLVTAFMNTKDAGEKYEEQLKKIREQQDKNIQSSKNYYERELANARALGASDVELQKIKLKGLQEEYDQASKNYQQAYKQRIDAEYFNKQAVKALKEDEDAKFDILLKAEQNLSIAKADLRGSERQADEQAAKTRIDNAKKASDILKRQQLEELNAKIAIERAKDTRDKASVENLRKLILQKILLEKDGIKITKEIQQAAEEEANRQAEEEINRDVQAYKDGLERKREANQIFLDQELRDLRESQRQKEDYYERLKTLYGEDSLQALRQFQVVLEGRQSLIIREQSLLTQFRNTEEGLSKEQLARFDQLGTEYNKILSQRIVVVNELGKKLMEADNEQTNAEKKRLNSIISNDKEILKNRLDATQQYLDLLEKEAVAKDVAALAAYETQKAFIEQNITDDQFQKDALVANDIAYKAKLKDNEEQYIKDLKILNEIYNQLLVARAEYNNQIVQSIAGTMSNIASFLYDIAGKNKKAQKAAVVIDKAAAVGRIVSETAVANAKALAASPLTAGQPWITLNTASAVASTLAVIGSTIRAIREIDSTSTEIAGRTGVINVIARRARGGVVSGPGTSMSDSIPTMLSNGEYVINANASRMFAPILSQLNALGNQPQFSMGSLLTQAIGNTTLGATLDQDMQERTTPPIKTYVSATDMSNQQQMDRLIKSRSLI